MSRRRKYDEAQLFDNEWVVDQIARQPDARSAAAKTVELAAAQVRAERKASLRAIEGGKARRRAT